MGLLHFFPFLKKSFIFFPGSLNLLRNDDKFVFPSTVLPFFDDQMAHMANAILSQIPLKI